MAGKGKGYGAEVFLALRVNTENNTIELPSYPKAQRLIHSLLNEDDEIEVRLRKIEYKRTEAQNRYYWGVCVAYIMKFLKGATGTTYSRDMVHAYNLKNIWGTQPTVVSIPNIRTGELEEITYIKGKTTSQMNTLEFIQFVDDLILYWAECGLVIPLPKPKQNNYLTDFIK